MVKMLKRVKSMDNIPFERQSIKFKMSACFPKVDNDKYLKTFTMGRKDFISKYKDESINHIELFSLFLANTNQEKQ
jgi:hypothetical protein